MSIIKRMDELELFNQKIESIHFLEEELETIILREIKLIKNSQIPYVYFLIWLPSNIYENKRNTVEDMKNGI